MRSFCLSKLISTYSVLVSIFYMADIDLLRSYQCEPYTCISLVDYSDGNTCVCIHVHSDHACLIKVMSQVYIYSCSIAEALK